MQKTNITFDFPSYKKAVPDGNLRIPLSHIQNNRGYYTIKDTSSQAKQKATLQLLNELEKGKKSGEERGWLSASEVRAHFQKKANEK